MKIENHEFCPWQHRSSSWPHPMPWRAALVWLSAMAWSAGCATAGTMSHSEPGGRAPAGASAPSAAARTAAAAQPAGPLGAPQPRLHAERTATSWFDALRAADVGALGRLSSYPFHLRTTGSDTSCSNGDAPDESAFPGVMNCLVTHDVLGEELAEQPVLETSELKRETIPVWARPWRKELHARATPVAITLRGNGVTFYFLLQIDDSGVSSVWTHSDFDPN